MKSGLWQYHPRSDRHSKIACWCILFDVLQSCPLLQRHVADEKVCFGINHEMRDFEMNRAKNLDLVVCRPRDEARGKRSFRELVDAFGVRLTRPQRKILEGLPDIAEAPVGAVHLALEAKACMTEHQKARPRLHDELDSSHLAIHGAVDHAIAAAFVMVNLATTFVSPTRAGQVNTHRQPHAVERVLEKVKQIRRRSKLGDKGFGALGVVVVNHANDGTPVRLATKPPAPARGDVFHYDMLINRVSNLYSSRFGHT